MDQGGQATDKGQTEVTYTKATRTRPKKHQARNAETTITSHHDIRQGSLYWAILHHPTAMKPEDAEERRDARTPAAMAMGGNDHANVGEWTTLELWMHWRGPTGRWRWGVVRASLKSKTVVSEIYSPRRIAAMARKIGLMQGVSLDFTVPTASGYVLDFSKESCRRKAKELIKLARSYVRIGSPECMAFARLRYINGRTPEGRARGDEKVAAGKRQLFFCVDVCRMQIASGWSFLHEHPMRATSWDVPCVKALMPHPGVLVAETVRCACDLTAEDELGRGRRTSQQVFN